jgi:hypothetical protein
MNREVLKWIKHWDRVVFQNASTKPNEDSRPEKKILLMYGDPGIGNL